MNAAAESSPASKPLTDIKSLGLEEISTRLAEWGQPSYRAGQIADWLYPRRASAWGLGAGVDAAALAAGTNGTSSPPSEP